MSTDYGTSVIPEEKWLLSVAGRHPLFLRQRLVFILVIRQCEVECRIFYHRLLSTMLWND